MPYPDDFTPAETEQLFRELQEIDSKRVAFRAQATPQYAQAINQLAQLAPQAEASLIEPVARAVANGVMTPEQASSTVLDTQKIVLNDPASYEQDKPQGGFLSRLQDNVMDVVKSGSRWTFAAANLVPQLATNLGSRVVGGTVGSDDQPGGVYERPETGFFDGWFASTDLGSMMSGKDYGEGFFIGEEALKYQEEQAKRYRGTVGNGGWTFGRGLASTFFQPDTKQYNILSGLVDAGAALAIPSVPGLSQTGKLVTGARRLTGLAARSTAGLADFGNAQIVASRVRPWLRSGDGIKVVDHLVNNVDDIEKGLATFKNASNDFIEQVVKTTDHQTMLKLLEDNLGTTGLASRSDIDLRAAGTTLGQLGESWSVGRSIRRTRQRLGASVDDGTVALDFSEDYARNDSVRKVLNTMKTLRVDEYTRLDGSVGNRKELLERLVRVTNLDNPEDFRGVMDEIDEMIAYAVGNTKRIGGRSKARLQRQAEQVAAETGEEIFSTQQAARTILRNYRDTQEMHLFGAVDDEARSYLFGLGGRSEFADTPELMDNMLEGSGMYMEPVDIAERQNLLEATTIGEGGKETRGVFMAPDMTGAVLGEQRAFAASMPSIRALRRETSRLAFMFTRSFKDANAGFGDPAKWVTLLDIAQNRVWRTGTLMTGGYAIRNISESMVRSAMAPGIRTGPAHPIEWILAMTKRRGFGSIDGIKWTDEALSTEAARLMREYTEATGATMREALDASALQYKAYQTGAWRIANATGDRALYRQGLQDQIHLLAEDPIMRLVAQGKTTDEIFDYLNATDEGKAAARAMQARWTNKRPAGAGKDVRVTYDFVNKNGDLNRSNWEKLIDMYYRERFVKETGDSPELKNIIATFNEGGVFELDGQTFKAFKLGELGGGRTMAGVPELLGYNPEYTKLINRLIDDDITNLPQTVKHRVHANARGLGNYQSDHGKLMQSFSNTVNHFFTDVFGKKEAFINRSPAFRQFYYAQVRNLLSRVNVDEAKKIVANVEAAYLDEVGEVYKTLRGIKAGDDGMFRIGSELVDQAEYSKRLGAAKAARDAKMEGFNDNWARRYLGGGSVKERVTGKSLWDDLTDRANGVTSPIEGATFTADQVSLAARGYAAEEVKKLFYNAAETSNLADIMRIVSPFGQAWAEVMQAWYKQVLLNPNRLKNMSVTFRGVRDMDPDGDGKGFLYTDPVTGEMMFNYPFIPGMAPIIFGVAGGLAGQTLLGRGGLGMRGAGLAGVAGGAAIGALSAKAGADEGLSATLAAPVKSANMALNVLPSVGPVVQIAANQILGDKPQFDDLRSFLLPYGSVEPTPAGFAEQLTPSWAKKMIQAITADPENDRMFGDMYWDSMNALYATGEFDRNDPESMRELDERARSSARHLLMLRSLGQLVGPARPDIVLNVPTKFEGEIDIADIERLQIEGNIPNNVLSKAFRYFQEEDFDTAVTRFIETFGDDTLLYTIGSTTAISRGLDASQEFGDWERTNGGFRSANPDVFGYFAPVGSQFDLETYLRQINSGDRQRRTDWRQALEEAESVVGRAMYRQLTRQFGPNPTDAQELIAKRYKLYLQEALPGYAYTPFNVNERAEIIQKLEEAANDPLVADNEIARAAKVYFETRSRLVNIANSRRTSPALSNPLSGTQNADLRAYLRYTGETLVRRYPEFDRMFSRELFNEVDMDA